MTSSDGQYHPHALGNCYEPSATGKGGMEGCKDKETQVILKNEQRSGDLMLLPRMKGPCWKCGSASVIISRESKKFSNKRTQVKYHTDNTHDHSSLPRYCLFLFEDTTEPLKVLKVNLLTSGSESHLCSSLLMKSAVGERRWATSSICPWWSLIASVQKQSPGGSLWSFWNRQTSRGSYLKFLVLPFSTLTISPQCDQC